MEHRVPLTGRSERGKQMANITELEDLAWIRTTLRFFGFF